ncbi:hypothetical protein DP117_16225 [Brasilonema sp. UFV-L1]|nr:hypothetical protein [Brasilonema sp. UFV-L1]
MKCKETELIRNFFILIMTPHDFPVFIRKTICFVSKYFPDFIRGLTKTYQQKWHVEPDQTINVLAALGTRAPKLRR